MASWNVCCAICGGPFATIYWDSEINSDIQYDPNIISNPGDPELDWLRDVNLIGENLEDETPSRIWVSGPVTAIDGASMHCEARDDPAVVSMPDSGSIIVYTRNAGFPWSAPFHTRCYRILCQYLSVSELNKDIFFATLESMAGDSGSRLDLDYGDIGGSMYSSWGTRRGEEYFVFNPVEVKGLSEFYNNLPPLRIKASDTTNVFSTTEDPFTKLPSDVLLLIISFFKDIGTIYELRRASPAVANLPLGNGFWRKRLTNDMPWLWDLPTLPGSQLEKVDWKHVYHKLDWATRKFSADKNKFHGLCNRKRIWTQMCPKFAETYTEYAANMKSWGSIHPPVLDGASVTTPISLRSSSIWDETSKIETLLNVLTDLPTAQPHLAVFWSNDLLLDIQILQDRNETSNTSPMLEPCRTETICVPGVDWITGFVVTSRQVESCGMRTVGLDILFAKQAPVKLGSNVGDRCLLNVEPDRFLVALRLFHTKDGNLLTRMSLIQQTLAHAGRCERVLLSVS